MLNRWFASGLLVVLGAVATACAQAESYASGWYREVQLSLARDDNTTRASESANRIPDTVSTLSLGLGYSNIIGDGGKIILSSYLQYSNYGRTRNLGNFSASLGARYIFQIAPGYDHPWYNTSFNVARLDHRGSDGRNGYLLSTGISANRRITGRLTGHAGYRFDDMLYPGGPDPAQQPFDVSRHEIFVGADYSIARRSWLYASAGYGRGTFTSSASGAQHPATYGYDASAHDAAFEDCPTCNWWAYRYKGNLGNLKLGIAFSSRGIDYDVSGRYVHAGSNGGRTYRDTLLELGASFDF